jgi:hypothetical protein
MTDKLKERIKVETEVFRLVALVTVGIGGGTVSLSLGDLTPYKLAWVWIGSAATAVASLAVWFQYRTLRKLIDQLPEDAK